MRVTVVGSVVCVSVLNISPLERLFVLQSVPHTQRAAKVRIFVWFSLKMLRSRARALPSLYGHVVVGYFYSTTYARACTCAASGSGGTEDFPGRCGRRNRIKWL